MRFRIERSWGTVRFIAGSVSGRNDDDGERGLLSPETLLTKSCIVEADAGERERDDVDEERMFDSCDFFERKAGWDVA